MMKHLLPLCAVAVVAACSNPEKTGGWLIDPPTAGVRVPNALGTAELKDVSLPEYASGQEVAFQTPDGAVRSNPDNIWADSPGRAFTNALAGAISDMSGATVIAEPWPLAEPPRRVIQVRVDRALTQADGHYRLSGRYFVADDRAQGTNHVRRFDIRVPVAEPGAGGTAGAASQALSQLAQQIATLSGPGTTIATSAPADPFANLPPLF
ncbi:membrane integrity-associated transporter subunit PqiC [Paracoccus sp. (in: a-proteobacteria)]|uniref:PqiC family protein n=1 Tax=Paracoccus sp. TaxID=267 RepID=UPI0026E0941C|nr:PqiC family protein [Paracoccus sp. (in: a-proteobacteria)]MDO5647485.1 PqiC family protein [Paracoccus sp. (in: a-proteobacteria)]